MLSQNTNSNLKIVDSNGFRSSKQTVCVIGAGYAGLCATHLLREDFEVTVFERHFNVGGLWNYDENTGDDRFGIPMHSAMYQNVRTNFPKEIMDFPDFPNRSEDYRSFRHRSKVLEYLESYAKHFQLHSVIKFEHMVEEIRPQSYADGNSKWMVTVRDLKKNMQKEQHFDKVFVCSGHFSKPHIPSDLNLKDYQRKWIHSKDYRYPDQFMGQTVAVLGAGPSGVDISSDIASSARVVYICHDKNREHLPFPENVVQKPSVRKMLKDALLLENGDILQVDCLVLATGYEYDFPFLKEVHLSTTDNLIRPLYKQMIHVDYPDSLFLVGLQRQVPQGYMVHVQMRYILALLKGQIKLPRDLEKQATKEVNRDLLKCIPPRKIFKLGYRFRSYIRDLEEQGLVDYVDRVPEVVLRIFEDVISTHDVCSLREFDYRMIDDYRFKKLSREVTNSQE